MRKCVEAFMLNGVRFDRDIASALAVNKPYVFGETNSGMTATPVMMFAVAVMT